MKDQFGHELDKEGHPIIEWTPEKLRAFRALYKDAMRLGANEFTFEGLTFVTTYSKYLIDFLREKFR